MISLLFWAVNLNDLCESNHGLGEDHDLGVSENSGTPKSSILIGFSIINHPFWVPLFLETPLFTSSKKGLIRPRCL